MVPLNFNEQRQSAIWDIAMDYTACVWEYSNGSLGLVEREEQRGGADQEPAHASKRASGPHGGYAVHGLDNHGHGERATVTRSVYVVTVPPAALCSASANGATVPSSLRQSAMNVSTMVIVHFINRTGRRAILHDTLRFS